MGQPTRDGSRLETGLRVPLPWQWDKLDDFQIRFISHLGWVHLVFYRQIIAEMLRRGLLITIAAADAGPRGGAR